MSLAPPRRRISILAVFLGLVLVGISVALAYKGWSFYQLSVDDRPDHPDYKLLRPTGLYGNGYGWIAALLVIMNLSYLLRRRFASARFGSMRVWLDIHVFTGLLASVLVSFHSAFQLRNLVATISAISLGVVVLTGLIGRFLYALTPAVGRTRLRDALDAVEAEWPGHRSELQDALDALPGPTVPPNASMIRSVLAIPRWLHASSVRTSALATVLPPRAEQSRAFRKAAKALDRAAAADARASGMAALMRSWRGLHRLFALAMLVTVLLHAGIAWFLGYRWIFG